MKLGFVDKIESFLSPISEKLEQNFVLTIVRKAMSFTIPITIIGSFYLLILYFPGLEDIYPEGFLAIFTGIFGPIYSLCVPLLSIYVVCAVGYFYGQAKESNPIMNAIVALISFLIVTPLTDGNLTVEWLGAKGLFVGFFTAFISSYIYNKIVKSNLTIKLPSAVPPMVAEPFLALIPALITFVVFGVINYACTFTAFNTLHNIVYSLLQLPLMGLGTSYYAILICAILNGLLWSFGIHGGNIITSVMSPIWTAALTANLDALAAGKAAEYIVTTSFWSFFVAGGTPLALGILCAFFAKSEQNKAIGKLGIIPAIFGIGEPLQFGVPITGNPILFVPFVLTYPVRASIAYFALAAGIVPLTNGVTVSWTMPPILAGFLATGSILGGLLQVIQIIVDLIIWYPFFKVLDSQYLKEEKEDIQIEEN